MLTQEKYRKSTSLNKFNCNIANIKRGLNLNVVVKHVNVYALADFKDSFALRNSVLIPD